MTKRAFLSVASALVAALVIAPVLVSAAGQDTVQQVIDKHLAAMGGRDAIMKITNRRATGTIVVSTQMGDLSGPLVTISKAPNKSRATMKLDLSALGAQGEMVAEQLFDGTNAWSLNSMQGDQQIAGRQLANMMASNFPSPFINPPSGVKVELLPNETVAGVSYIVLHSTSTGGSDVKIYLDPKTYLIARTTTSIDNPADGGQMVASTEPSDYRTVDGVKVPFTIVNNNDVQTITLKYTKVEHNVDMPDSMFVKK